MKRDALKDFTKSIEKIEGIIGYTFRDKSLITQAFTRTSFINENPGEACRQANEVLEFFGDSVLSLVIVSLFIEGNVERNEHGIRTRWTEGDFTTMKAHLADKTNLSRSMAKLGLAKYLITGEGDKKLGIADEPSVMEDLFESIVGAVYIDSGKDIEVTKSVLSHMLDTSLYTTDRTPTRNARNSLQEYCQDKKRRLPLPVYVTLSEEGPDHKKTYERGVYIGDRLIARAKAKNQKQADLEAARLALELLEGEDGK